MVSGAYQTYQSQIGTVPATSRMSSLTPFMNYVAIDSSTVIDDKQTGSTYTCGACNACSCLKLHNGGMFRYAATSGYTFGGTSPTSSLWFDIDPDGVVTDGTTNGPGKAIEFMLFYNG